MRYTIREFEREGKFSQALSLDVFDEVISGELIQAALQATGRVTHRERKLSLNVTVWVVILLYLFARTSVRQVVWKLAQGTRLLWPDPEYVLPGDSAVAYRRKQLGVRPLALLCRWVCRPLAQPETAAAFGWGLRLVALDGTVDAVADTPQNAAVFGRATNAYTPSAYPLVRGVHLVECGTHALLDVTFWPYAVGERQGAYRLMRSVQPDWLLMWDGGLHAFELWQAARARGAQVLAYFPRHLRPQRGADLSDGTQLVYLQPARRPPGQRLAVRLIRYTLTDPALPGYQQVHQLATTLLDPHRYPALDLVELYHSRWEFEATLDEVETHQRLTAAPLRGLTPSRVLQELYGLVLAHYAVRALMCAAARQAGVSPTRLSFTHAIDILRQAVCEFQLVAPTCHPQLFQRLWRDLLAGALPPRRLRTAPRVVKRRLSKYLRKQPEHRFWPQPTVIHFRNAIALI